MAVGLSAKDTRQLVAAQLAAALISKSGEMDATDAVELYRAVLVQLKTAGKHHWQVSTDRPTRRPAGRAA